MTDHDRIKQMVMDAGLPAQVSAHPAFKQFVREHAALIAGDCAEVAYGKVAEGRAHESHVAIRARYPLHSEAEPG
jgi:hypothetical protein